jgi:hypothetical protein
LELQTEEIAVIRESLTEKPMESEKVIILYEKKIHLAPEMIDVLESQLYCS